MENRLFKNRLKYILDKNGWTQVDLSKKTGIHIKTIHRWMKLDIAPNSQKLHRVTRETGVNIKWLKNNDYEGPLLEKNRWTFETDEKLNIMTRSEIGQIYSRLREIKQARNLNTPQLLEAADINIHATEDETHFLGFPPYGLALEKIGAATDYNKDWILTGIGPKYLNADQVASPEAEYDLHGGGPPLRPEMKDKDHQMLGKAFDILRSKSVYQNVLMANIEAFFNALKAEKKHSECLRRIQELEERLFDLEKKLEPEKI